MLKLSREQMTYIAVAVVAIIVLFMMSGNNSSGYGMKMNGNGMNGNGNGMKMNGNGMKMNGNGNGNDMRMNGNGNGMRMNGNGNGMRMNGNGNGNGNGMKMNGNGNGMKMNGNGNGMKMNGNGGGISGMDMDQSMYANIDGNGNGAILTNTNGCAMKSGVGLSSSLLPREVASQENFGEFAPQDILKGQSFLDPRKQVGMPETAGGSLRNSNQQIRSEPPNPKKEYLWQNSTIVPDLMQRKICT